MTLEVLYVKWTCKFEFNVAINGWSTQCGWLDVVNLSYGMSRLTVMFLSVCTCTLLLVKVVGCEVIL